MSLVRGGKARMTTAFVPSKHITMADLKRQTERATIYPEQQHRKKQSTGRAKKRLLFNKRIQSVGLDQEQDKLIGCFSLQYPIIDKETGFVTSPAPSESLNSHQRQLHNAQMDKQRQFIVEKKMLEKKRREETVQKKEFILAIPTRMAPTTNTQNFYYGNRASAITGVRIQTGGKMH